jgi:hypothetical protein
VPWAEVTDMEYGIKVEVEGELKMIVEVSNLFEDFV